MKAKLHYVFSFAIFLMAFSVMGQNSSWKKIETSKKPELVTNLGLNKDKVNFYELDMVVLKNKVSLASLKNSKKKQLETIIYMPSKNGDIEPFAIYEDPVLSPSLSAKYPNIKSYYGFSKNNPRTRLRMSISHHGVQTMITSVDHPSLFMQPISKGSNHYILYDATSKNNLTDKFECKTLDELNASYNKNSKITIDEGGANDQTLQKFRIAISTTAEYTAYHYVSDSTADALAAINATLSRVNEVFETDMAVKFELVDATQLIYTNVTTDPYSDANIGAEGAWNSELQSTLTSVISEAAYDIGHLFGASGGGGNAGCIGCVCVDNSKGSGYTSPSDAIPEGDTFDIDFVAHEIGHQMGANHTWAFDVEGTGVNSEPGSGSTIMGYAGITGPDDVQTNSDDYFHYHSIKQILENLNLKSCQTTEAISNNPPIVNAGVDYHIPAGTAYILKGAATDLDSGDNLTYCWEQIDSGVSNYLNFGPELSSESMNRSLPPSMNSNRYIPRLSSVLAGNTTQTNPTLGSDWETVSTVGRTLNWALTVRDRNPSNATAAQTSFDTMIITVEDVLPFTVINPTSWAQGNTVTISWNVGQTNNATINCQNVTIKLSTDGGLTFPTIIANNTANDGSYDYVVPAMADTSTARIMVEAADNIFYDVSDFDFTISQNPDFFIVETGLNPIPCGATSVSYTFDYVTTNGFSNNTVFSTSSLPAGATASFSPTNLSVSGSFTLTINNLTTEGDYTFTVTGTSSFTKNISVNLPFYNGLCSSVANVDYNTSTTSVQFNTINNPSGKPSGYSNYTSISTNVNRSGSYDLTVNVNTEGPFTTQSNVWIDWNQNCSFNDPGEAYNLGTATNVSNGVTLNSPLSITVPFDAVLGSTVMRVSTKFNTAASACENAFDGEVEDYTVNILPTLAIEEFGFDNFKVYPNPNNGAFTVKLSGSLERKITIRIYDLRGRTIYNKTHQNVGDFTAEIQLNQAQSGMYLLNISDGVRKETKKLVIK